MPYRDWDGADLIWRGTLMGLPLLSSIWFRTGMGFGLPHLICPNCWIIRAFQTFRIPLWYQTCGAFSRSLKLSMEAAFTRSDITISIQNLTPLSFIAIRCFKFHTSNYCMDIIDGAILFRKILLFPFNALNKYWCLIFDLPVWSLTNSFHCLKSTWSE